MAVSTIDSTGHGFLLEIEDRVIVNLGDTLKRLDQWSGIPRPDVLMIPIGGDKTGNTMGNRDAIEVTKALRPCTVIPCHHNLPSFFKKNANPTDVRGFAEAVEAIGIECRVLSRAETVTVWRRPDALHLLDGPSGENSR